MSGFEITPVAEQVCRHVRQQRTDPIYGYAYDVAESVAGPNGYGPCRQCLKKFTEGERRLLFLYNPFSTEIGDFAGPIFIHEQECTPFPAGDAFPDQLRDLPLLLRSYDTNGHFLAEIYPEDRSIEAGISELFDTPAAHEVHIRNTQAKCFVAKAARTGNLG